MLSNKLTFSLASLVVLLIVGLCLPVVAQEKVSLLITGPGSLGPGRDTGGFDEDSFGIYGHGDGVACYCWLVVRRHFLLTADYLGFDDPFNAPGANVDVQLC